MPKTISNLKDQLFSSDVPGGEMMRLGSGGCRRYLFIPIIIVALILVFMSTEIVDAGHRAVIFNNVTGGLSARGEGVTLLVPFLQSITVYDVRTETFTLSKTAQEGKVRGGDSVQTLTSDGQQVDVDISVQYHPDPNRIIELHRQIGPDYENKIVLPAARSVTRTAVSKYAVVDVYGGRRAEIQEEVTSELRNLFEKNFLVLDGVLLRNVDFTPEFKKAIELKQIAQQEAERKKYELERERIEKERKIIEAEGEAQSIRLRGEALAKNPALIQYEYVQKITPGVQTIITDGRSILSLGDLVKGTPRQ